MLGISVLCVAVLYISTATGQPTTCYEGLHCAVGYYCEIDTHVCRECLRCQDLKREPAVTVTPNACIKSVSECGPCTKGLVVDRRGNVDAECVPPDTSTEGGGMTAYLWLFIIAGMLFVGLVLGIIVYVLRNSEEIFKTPAANQRRITSITASAPESPPPYNQLPYESVPAESPTPYLYTDIGRTDIHELDEHPFIKRASSVRPPSSRESDANQAARVYNPPYYSRKTQPPSVEQPAVSEVEEDTMIAIHDEETTPSAWVPSSDTNVGDDNANGAAGVSSTSLSKQLAVARETTVIESPPAKKPCVRQDTNNNRNRESNSCEGGYPQSPSPGQAGGVITQIINVVQFNNK